MAHAGGVKPSIQMQIVDGKLVVGKAEQRLKVVDSLDLAIKRLFDGEIVFVQQYANLPDQVQRTVTLALGAKGETVTPIAPTQES